MEKKCRKHGVTQFVLRSDNSYRCKKCAVDAVNKRRRKIKTMALEYKGGKCEKCGYDKCKAALGFHHLDPTKKLFNLGEKGHTHAWAKVKIELDKCQLLCANCHLEEHWSGA